MDADFEDIRIVDLDLSKTTWSRVHETLRIMFLKLDREPPDNDWTRLFFEERETRIVARRHGLWIEDGYVSFDSLPNEIETIHLPDIRRSIDYANREYRKLVAKRRLQRAGQQQDIADERAELLALRERVRVALGGAPAPVEPASVATLPRAAANGVRDAAPPTSGDDSLHTDFEARRESLKERFRLALNHLDKELKRGND